MPTRRPLMEDVVRAVAAASVLAAILMTRRPLVDLIEAARVQFQVANEDPEAWREFVGFRDRLWRLCDRMSALTRACDQLHVVQILGEEEAPATGTALRAWANAVLT